MSSKDHIPDSAEFGQLVSRLMKRRDPDGNKIYADANAVKLVYGEPGRTLGQIAKDAALKMKDYPKA